MVGLLLVIIRVAACAFSVLGSAETVSSPRQAPSSFSRNRYGKLSSSPPVKESHIPSSVDHFPNEAPPNTIKPSSIALPPSISSFQSPAKKWMHSPTYSPSISSNRNLRHHHARNHHSTPGPSYLIPPPSYNQIAPSVPSFHSSSPSSMSWDSLAPALSPTAPKSHFSVHIHPPAMSPLNSNLKKMKAPQPSQILSLPPPPPNGDCASVTCAEPLTYTPPGTFCGCVWPIQVKLRLGVAIYSFFTLVTELAEEIAASVALNHCQVRIMGANAASQQLEKSTVLINLVPEGVKFADNTALSIYKKFWNRQVLIKASLFGSYEVLYVHYPGLPPSPPSPLSISTIDDEPYPGRNNNGRTNKPLGVDVTRRKKDGLGGSTIAVIVLSSFTALVIFMAIAWLFMLKCGNCVHQPQQAPQASMTSPAKPSGTAGPMILGGIPSSSSMSFSSGAMTYTGPAKVYSLNDIERATNKFDSSRILGEGGFGVVYSGQLDDGRKVAVKVLKRDDQHGGREFLAEVEMLGRLHHRNLVKLIGICTEEHTRCLVYELIPNGSVESHLHGVDKETDPLNWDARMKIALGAARGLAYLHEDSNPRVIHRDFKSSNILLEHDFTPKVSDFGLARAAMEEENKHISTHVMGTFGYLAPEYAMTGHLLVKSDVYSYGVVLLELLTGRKPVDLSQPPGQENLVGYARPLLTNKEGLETIIDPAIKFTVSFDTIVKVAAIASMCVQPEVSHRPFMGEVVQALKLVCNEFNEMKVQRSSSQSYEHLLTDVDSKNTRVSYEIMEVSQSHHPLPLSTSDLFTISVGLEEQEFGYFRRHSSSGPLRTGRRRQFWQRLRSLSRGSMSEHGFSLKLWSGTS
ncbi:receptor-like serine/threonine-protein kinase ALE2 isoform X2 [Hevea brasiliensis]|uniref:receptor-like serine/threonine-protein kinase ALE2 isoform X2 n=1 Tax=Hevea brasiliensis TaxID=3981 RepID=UPI0025D3D39B|nr:receptor-like serine/threonine-protein kinase ALE2 isoform X2 [Hevea brasiliensis]